MATERITSSDPISAPPFPSVGQVVGPPEVDAEDFAEARQYIAASHGPVDTPRRMREMMRISNRFNYSQYYLLPARVGVRMLADVMDDLFREGCKLTDIQVTFEVVEVGQP